MTNPSMGHRISALRKEKGLTQKELAEKMNVTDKAVSKWERNISCPDINSIPTLAGILGVSTDELLNAAAEGEKEDHKRDERNRIINLILKAVPLAMGVALVVTSVLGELTLSSGFSMAGIGLCCLGLERLHS
ncbi:MAG: helix-turn-helix domain-containing protein [Clostridia bacterium]